MLENGATKAEVQERLGNAVGVAHVDLDVRTAETFVLMGLSGSGKSTLLRLLNRLHEPTRGSIVVDDVDITELSRRELLEVRRQKFSGMVFQQFAILPHRTVLDNVGYGLEVQGTPEIERRDKAQSAIELVGLAGWERSYPRELSGGMQQRVGLARALAVDADILLMDEAFSALDPLIRREMQDELIDLQTRMRKTIVFVTHDLDEALRLGDRIAIMKDARVVQVGTPEEVITEPADDYVAAFVEGVDRSDVLTAGSIMQPVKETARLQDGPQTALNKMRRAGISGVLVVDAERKVLGYLRSEPLVAALREGAVGQERIHGDLMESAPIVGMDTPLHEVIGVASEGSTPVAVTDAAGRLRGVVVKGAILAALARPGRNGAEDRTDTQSSDSLPPRPSTSDIGRDGGRHV
ncbi:MAG TPA: glycine betaine/L-proline ABC transporter ATP-binding protein [Trueperaceae bacterium]|nr:glycine betaine/L-proline ABC transporter ATP-binding protein [Trueperaceae bacterium]